MSVCCSPRVRLTHPKFISYIFSTGSCNRFPFASTSEPAPRLSTNSRSCLVRQFHTKHPILPSTRLAYHANRTTLGFLHQNASRTLWVFAFLRRFRWRKPPEMDEATRQNEEEAAKVAILEKAFESRQPADLMLRCELPSTNRLFTR